MKLKREYITPEREAIFLAPEREAITSSNECFIVYDPFSPNFL